MRFLPLGLEITGRPCLIVGGGEVGTRKARTLAGAGGAVTVVSPHATPALTQMARAGELRWIPEPFRAAHLDGVLLAVAATDDEATNALVVEGARTRGILFCDATSAERSQVIFGALHEAGGLTVAVFTDGRDPSRARRVRDRIALHLEGEKDDPGSTHH